MRKQIEGLLRGNGGVESFGNLKIEYRPEQPWGIPATLDVFRETTWTDAKKKVHKVRLLPDEHEQLAKELPLIVEEVVHPPSGIILSLGAQGIGVMWRMTPAQSGYTSPEERFERFRNRVQQNLPEGLDVSLAKEELHRFFAEHYTPNRAAHELTGWLQALTVAGVEHG